MDKSSIPFNLQVICHMRKMGCEYQTIAFMLRLSTTRVQKLCKEYNVRPMKWWALPSEGKPTMIDVNNGIELNA